MPAPKNDTPTLKKMFMSAGIDPAVVANWSTQKAGMLGQYADTQALLKADKARMLQAFRQQKRDIRTTKTQDLRAAVGAANDRGVLGSSSDVDARADVISGAAAQRMAARDAYSQGLIQNRMQRTQAQRDLTLGLSGLAADRAATRSQAALSAYERKLYDDLIKALQQGQGGGGGGAGGGAGGQWAQQLAGARGMQGLARRIEKVGGGLFDVSELLGFQGGVQAEHTGTGHGAGLAMDINVTRRNNTPFETRKLRRLDRVLRRLYGDYHATSLGKWNDPKGHPTHLHWEAELRRWLNRNKDALPRPEGAPTGPQA